MSTINLLPLSSKSTLLGPFKYFPLLVFITIFVSRTSGETLPEEGTFLGGSSVSSWQAPLLCMASQQPSSCNTQGCPVSSAGTASWCLLTHCCSHHAPSAPPSRCLWFDSSTSTSTRSHNTFPASPRGWFPASSTGSQHSNHSASSETGLCPLQQTWAFSALVGPGLP